MSLGVSVADKSKLVTPSGISALELEPSLDAYKEVSKRIAA